MVLFYGSDANYVSVEENLKELRRLGNTREGNLAAIESFSLFKALARIYSLTYRI